ncbi:hypothetical protein FXB40_44715 [Bradyrhizobium rifense]|uniref:Uncharacterized protein n=1 Tax=Bradyrhizobium rifense TaxID=515499 RepID=A0A5D3JWM1_9BRAD|nr:hypothetical protein [Bradyrhizobium rifense]TYL84506.1 hypothetical protein FXB40_44715 [Bradyrhizobium rifense]
MGLSNAARQARHRAKRAAEMEALRNGAAPSQGAEVNALRKRVRELEAALGAKPKPAMTLDMISTKTGREQAEIFMRQQEKRFEGEIRRRVQAEVAAWMEQMLPEYKKRLEESDRVIKTRKGFMKKALFNKFRFAIHEDTYSHRSAKERAELCQWLEEHETVLVAEDEKPTTLPTLEELMRNREAIRRANSERSKAAHARAKAEREAEKREADNSAL